MTYKAITELIDACEMQHLPWELQLTDKELMIVKFWLQDYSRSEIDPVLCDCNLCTQTQATAFEKLTKFYKQHCRV